MDDRSVTPEIRTLFWGVGTALSGLAGLVLFLLPDQTDRLFAWTIDRGDTAALIGAGFLGIGLMALLCYGVSTWAGVRGCFAGTLAYIVAMSVATLLHLDQFHFGSDRPFALLMAWAWTLVYLLAPFASLVLFLRQRRDHRRLGPSGEAPSTPIVPGLRALYLVQGALLVIVAVVLFLAPGSADTLWPWPLTPLAARAIASFMLGIGITLVIVGRDNAAERLEPPGAACWWMALLAGMAVTRFDGRFDLGSVPGLVFCVVLISLIVGGVAGELAARRLRPDTGD